MKLRLVLRVVDLLIARDDHDDRLVAELEAHGLGDARALDADGDGRQLHRGAGNVELADTAGDAEALKIGSYFFNGHGFSSFPSLCLSHVDALHADAKTGIAVERENRAL